MRLWIQFAIAMILASVGPLVVTGYRATQLTEQQSDAQSQQRLERQADQTSAEMKRWLLSNQDFMAGWLTLFPDLKTRTGEQQIGFLRGVYRAMPAVVSASLNHPNGDQWRGQDGQAIPPQFLTEAQIDLTQEGQRGRRAGALEQALEARAQGVDLGLGGVSISEAYGQNDTLSAVFWARSADEDAPLLSVEMDLTELTDLLVSDAGVLESTLLNNAGQVLAGDQQEWVDATLIAPLIGKSAAFEYEHESVMYRGVIQPVPLTSWSLVVLEPDTVGQALGQSIQAQLWMALAASLLIAILAGILLSRPLSRPIGVLREAALAVADGDLGLEVNSDIGGEVGQLSDAFNHMSRTLESQRSEIEQFNAELQQRVEERTSELQATQKDLIRTGQLAAVAEVGAGLAHELNNPLAGILGLTQVLKMKLGEGAEAGLLSQVETQASRCRDVVDTMLRLSVPSEETMDAERVSVRKHLVEVFELCRASFSQRGVELKLDEFSPDIEMRVPVAHSNRISYQVLQCLRAGLSAGSTLVVGCEQRDNHVVIVLTPSQPVASGAAKDDWMASGAALWVARQMLEEINGRLEKPEAAENSWRMILPGGAG